MEIVRRERIASAPHARRGVSSQVGKGDPSRQRLRALRTSQEASELIGQEHERLDLAESAAEDRNPRQHQLRLWRGPADLEQEPAQVEAEAARRGAVGRVIGSDDHRNDIRRGENGLRPAIAQRAQCAGKLVPQQVGDACPGPPVAGDVDGPAALGGDELGEPGRQRLLRCVDTHPGGGRVAEDEHPQRLAAGALSPDDPVDVEARMGGQELKATQAHHLDRDEAHEAAEQPAQDARECIEPARHVDEDSVMHRDEAPRAERPLILVNPAAGGGRAARVARALGEMPGQLVLAESRERLRDLAAGASAAGHDRVVVIGGDGSVQDVVNGMLDAGPPVPLGIVPAGTGNDLAGGLGLPRDPRGALTLALGSRLATVDAGRARGTAGDRWFVSAAGVGFDAQVAAVLATRPPAARLGRVGYLLTTLLELRSFRNVRLALRLATPDGDLRIEQTCLFAAVANGPYYGGGMRICPTARLGDGLFDVCLVGDISRLGALREIPGIYRGAHVRNPRVSFYTVTGLEIEGSALAHLDGEPFGRLPVRFEVIPAALRIASARVKP